MIKPTATTTKTNRLEAKNVKPEISYEDFRIKLLLFFQTFINLTRRLNTFIYLKII